METLLLIGGLLLFVLLVVVHEYGHFIMARRNGVDVEEFGLGFPPKVKTFYKDSKGTEYTLNALPLGGFVRLKGEHDQDNQEGAFGAASLWAKTKIILAGVVMNLFTAWVLLTLLALVGMPKLPLPNGEEQYTVASDTSLVSNKVLVGYIEPNGPADKAGLKSGDQILGINCTFTDSNPQKLGCPSGSEITEAEQLRPKTEERLMAGDKTLNLIVERNNNYVAVMSTPRSLADVKASEDTDDPKGYLGVQPYDLTVQRSTWSAPVVGVGLIAQYSRLTYSALGGSIVSLFKGDTSKASENVSGPVGIFVLLKQGTTMGVSYVLLIIALISLTLAIMNTLPIPALDGGKLAVMLIFRAIKKPLTPNLEEKIHGTGFLALLALFFVITVVDIKRFF